MTKAFLECSIRLHGSSACHCTPNTSHGISITCNAPVFGSMPSSWPHSSLKPLPLLLYSAHTGSQQFLPRGIWICSSAGILLTQLIHSLLSGLLGYFPAEVPYAHPISKLILNCQNSQASLPCFPQGLFTMSALHMSILFTDAFFQPGIVPGT